MISRKNNNGIFAFSNVFFHRRHTVAAIHEVLLNLQLASEVHYSLPAFDVSARPATQVFRPMQYIYH